jgi:PadR family transcriptional regulator PadR
MGKGESLGEFEHLVLLALVRLGKEAYGLAVRQEIARRAERQVSIGAVYSTLDRLELKGLVRSSESSPTEARGGRRRRFFEVTAEGQGALQRTHRSLLRMTQGLGLSFGLK